MSIGMKCLFAHEGADLGTRFSFANYRKSEIDLYLIPNYPPIWVPSRQIQGELQPIPLFYPDPIRGTLIHARRFRAQAVLVDKATAPTLDPNRCRGVWFRPDPDVCSVLKSIEHDMLEALGRIRRGTKKADDAAVVGYLLQVFDHFLWTLAEEAGANALYKTFYDPIRLADVTECHMRNAMENERRGRSYEFGAWTLAGQIGPSGQDEEEKYRRSNVGRDRRKRKDHVESDSDMSISENGAGDLDVDDVDRDHDDLKSDRSNRKKRRKPAKALETTHQQLLPIISAQGSDSWPEKGTRAWKKWNAMKLLTTRGMQFVSSQQGSAPASRGTQRFNIRRKMEYPNSSTLIEPQGSRNTEHIGTGHSISMETNMDRKEGLRSSSSGSKVLELAVGVYHGSSRECAEEAPCSGSGAISGQISASNDHNSEKLQDVPDEGSWEVYLMSEGGTVLRLLGSCDGLSG